MQQRSLARPSVCVTAHTIRSEEETRRDAPPKTYSKLCEEGGVHFADFNIDRDFCGCVDGLVLVELDKLKPRKRRRYLQGEG